MSCGQVRQAWKTGADAVRVTHLVSHAVAGKVIDAGTGVATNPESARHYNRYRYDYGEYSQGATLSAKRTVKLSSDIYDTKGRSVRLQHRHDDFRQGDCIRHSRRSHGSHCQATRRRPPEPLNHPVYPLLFTFISVTYQL
jgi:hypothetical protein